MQPLADTSSATSSARTSTWNRFGDLVLILVTLLVMGRLCVAEFTTFDDFGTIYDNPFLKRPALDALRHYWGGVRTGEYGLYIPLTYTVWIGLAKLALLDTPDPAGIVFNPLVFHAANVLFHVLATLWVRRILLTLLHDARAAVVGALLFAVHPLQVEPVGWASGLKDVLSGTLSLAAVATYLQYRTFDIEGPIRRRTSIYASAVVLFLLSMLAKPSAMTVPAIAFVLDVTLLRERWRTSVRDLLPWVTLASPLLWIARSVQPASEVIPPPIWARPLVVLDSIAFYLCKLVWPLDLAVDYGRTPASVLATPWIRLTILIPIALSVLLFMYRRRSMPLLAAFLVFVISPFPSLGWITLLFQQFSTVADHYLYVAMLGPALVLGCLMTRPLPRWRDALVGVVLLLLSIRSIVQAGVWQDSPSLFQNAVRVTPNSTFARKNLGFVLMKSNDVGGAIEQFEAASRLRPDDVAVLDDLASLYVKAGRPADGEDTMARSIRLKESDPSLRRSAALDRQRSRLEELRNYLRQSETTRPGTKPN